MNQKDFWKALLAAIAVFILFQWVSTRFFPQEPPPAQQPPSQNQPAPAAATSQPPTTQGGVASSQPDASTPGMQAGGLTATRPDDAADAADLVLGSVDKAEGDGPYYTMRVDLTPNAGVADVKLTDFFLTPQGEEHYPVIDPLTQREKPAMGIDAVTIDGVGRADLSGAVWGVVGRRRTETGESITLAADVLNGRQRLLTVEQTWALDKGSYELKHTVRLVNRTATALKVTPHASGVVMPTREGMRADERTLTWGQRGEGQETAEAKSEGRGTVVEDGQGAGGWALNPDEGKHVSWAAVANKFFAVVIRPVPAAQGGQAPALSYVAYPLGADKSESDVRLEWASGALDVPAGDGQAAVLKFSDFVGPKSRDLFTGDATYLRENYMGMISYGGCQFCMFGPLITMFLYLLKWLYVVVHNYGVAIMILVAIVRLCLHPLTKKSQVSMAKMGKLQPQIEELKKQYGDDKQALNKAMAEFYREKGFSPMLGCLPMLLQMPIWIALWGVLNASIELRHAPFMLWINDLSAPDLLWQFAAPGEGFNLLFMDIYALNLLPILLLVAFFFQALFQPSTGTGPQAQQMKMMKYIMPLMMGVIFYNFPSGLTLYVMASSSVGAVEQYFIRKHIREADEAEKSGEKPPGAKSKDKPDPRKGKPKRSTGGKGKSRRR